MSTEKETQKAILEYLSVSRVFHYRNNSGAMKTETGGFYRFGAAGSPDIICVIDGRFVGIEVKDIKGRLNSNQEIFKKKLESAGGAWITARSIDDVIDFLK